MQGSVPHLATLFLELSNIISFLNPFGPMSWTTILNKCTHGRVITWILMTSRSLRFSKFIHFTPTFLLLMIRYFLIQSLCLLFTYLYFSRSRAILFWLRTHNHPNNWKGTKLILNRAVHLEFFVWLSHGIFWCILWPKLAAQLAGDG